MKVSGQLHALAAIVLEKTPLVHIEQEAGLKPGAVLDAVE
jgi:hypothetical protein